ncbi:ribosome maturation factor RimM [Schumannella soli]|uniref:Ribosome maturation factor RimM n=1 Tax=Schumannella soli TaxID=2590779 RepID=A0A506Y3P1_9MICO|nr:ribosome maturation factor RimM [Schumannella soli]
MRVARLVKAHGLKGALKLELYTDDPDRRFTPGASFALQVPTSSSWHGKSLELAELRFYNGSPVAFFVGVDDRTAAETLVKAVLWIDQDLDEVTDEEDAWFDHQLVGLSAVRDGRTVGQIARVDHLPAQDLLVVATDAGEVLVPFVKAIVPSVDIEAGIVSLTPPVGLFEEIPDADADADTDAEGSATGADSGSGEGGSRRPPLPRRTSRRRPAAAPAESGAATSADDAESAGSDPAAE